MGQTIIKMCVKRIEYCCGNKNSKSSSCWNLTLPYWNLIAIKDSKWKRILHNLLHIYINCASLEFYFTFNVNITTKLLRILFFISIWVFRITFDFNFTYHLLIKQSFSVKKMAMPFCSSKTCSSCLSVYQSL